MPLQLLSSCRVHSMLHVFTSGKHQKKDEEEEKMGIQCLLVLANKSRSSHLGELSS